MRYNVYLIAGLSILVIGLLMMIGAGIWYAVNANDEGWTVGMRTLFAIGVVLAIIGIVLWIISYKKII